MKRWILLYCTYDPDIYAGHRNVTFQAPDLEDAKKQAKALLEAAFTRRNFEFRLLEITGHDSGSRVWDTREEGRRQSDNDYTTRTYWEAPT